MCKKGQEWSQEQIDYLLAHYPTERACDIADELGKTKSSVHHKAHSLNLAKDKEGFFAIRSAAPSGEHSGNFRGYRRKTSKGYIVRYAPDHPSASKAGLVMEHRYVMEQKLGFVLPKEFDVHHINGDKTDNRIENLVVLTHGAHTILHNKEAKL